MKHQISMLTMFKRYNKMMYIRICKVKILVPPAVIDRAVRGSE
jgi:hypothetical protein